MTPLQIEALLRLHTHVDPFDGFTYDQKHSRAMRECYTLFHEWGLIEPWVEIDLRWGAVEAERLTARGKALVNRLRAVQP